MIRYRNSPRAPAKVAYHVRTDRSHLAKLWLWFISYAKPPQGRTASETACLTKNKTSNM